MKTYPKFKKKILVFMLFTTIYYKEIKIIEQSPTYMR